MTTIAARLYEFSSAWRVSTAVWIRSSTTSLWTRSGRTRVKDKRMQALIPSAGRWKGLDQLRTVRINNSQATEYDMEMDKNVRWKENYITMFFFGSLAKLLRSFAKKYCVPLRNFRLLQKYWISVNCGQIGTLLRWLGKTLFIPVVFLRRFVSITKVISQKHNFSMERKTFFERTQRFFSTQPSPCPSIQQDRTC